MSSLEEKLSKLKQHNAQVLGSDSRLAQESADMRSRIIPEAALAGDSVRHAIEAESIIMRRERPVLLVQSNRAQLELLNQTDSAVWRERLQRAEPVLESAIRAVGRIELIGSDYDWVGTGWLVAANIVVTNRHVAQVFAMRQGQGFVFRMGNQGPIRAGVDFLREHENPEVLYFRLITPLHIEPESGPDMAFFEVEIHGGNVRLAQPIRLGERPGVTQNVAVIGYPAFDSRIPETDLMEQIYGRIYNIKRLAPGGVTQVNADHLLHNCTTLGGNSGSVLLDLDRGEAIGLHFSGAFLTSNYAVRSDIVKARLAQLSSVRHPASGIPAPVVAPAPIVVPAMPPREVYVQASPIGALLSIPLKISISVQVDQDQAGAQVPLVLPTATEDDGYDEARSQDYRGRQGYQAGFLDNGTQVPLPEVVRDKAEVLTFGANHDETVLKYEHFSVVMHRSRRMCFFSAVNIDGQSSRRTRRGNWRWDPRIPKQSQIMQECYGPPPRFSRGHMTRREDPAWGSVAQAQLGNEDSMHVTNATPQMQAFNSPIWLALEDYALEHARQDDMRICVFTGPYFEPGDEVMHGVRIPVSFWKVIAFIHDETRQLCATGYQMSQAASLPDQEFVFGPFWSPHLNVATQVPLRVIEARSGLHFGNLAQADPLDRIEEGVSRPIVLDGPERIRYF